LALKGYDNDELCAIAVLKFHAAQNTSDCRGGRLCPPDSKTKMPAIKFGIPDTERETPIAEIERIIWKDSIVGDGVLDVPCSNANIPHSNTNVLRDTELCFVIGSGILHFIDTRGVRLVCSHDMANEAILKLLKFEYDEETDKFWLDLEGYFEAKCVVLPDER